MVKFQAWAMPDCEGDLPGVEGIATIDYATAHAEAAKFHKEHPGWEYGVYQDTYLADGMQVGHWNCCGNSEQHFGEDAGKLYSYTDEVMNGYCTCSNRQDLHGRKKHCWTCIEQVIAKAMKEVKEDVAVR